MRVSIGDIVVVHDALSVRNFLDNRPLTADEIHRFLPRTNHRLLFAVADGLLREDGTVTYEDTTHHVIGVLFAPFQPESGLRDGLHWWLIPPHAVDRIVAGDYNQAFYSGDELSSCRLAA